MSKYCQEWIPQHETVSKVTLKCLIIEELKVWNLVYQMFLRIMAFSIIAKIKKINYCCYVYKHKDFVYKHK